MREWIVAWLRSSQRTRPLLSRTHTAREKRHSGRRVRQTILHRLFRTREGAKVRENKHVDSPRSWLKRAVIVHDTTAVFRVHIR